MYRRVFHWYFHEKRAVRFFLIQKINNKNFSRFLEYIAEMQYHYNKRVLPEGMQLLGKGKMLSA